MNFSLYTVRKIHAAFACIALCAMILAPLAYVKAQAVTQGTLTVQKIISGTSTVPFTDFAFLINGSGETGFEADGTNRVALTAGIYDVTESAAPGFVTTYSNSLNGDDDCENLIIGLNATTTCTITNTALATSTGTTTPGMGTLVVTKEVNGGNAATSSFSFRINGGTPVTFEADGSNRIRLATGTYAITEVPVANYTPTYSNCMSAVVTANATTTCAITNNFNVGGAQLYLISGIKWEDADRDGVRDNNESLLQGWTISASQTGEITRTDVTDASGRFELLVTDGAWVVSETQQSNWNQTFPSGGTHTVTATGTASTTIPFPNINFGNVRVSSGGGGGGGGGGNGIRIELRDNDTDTSDDDEDVDDNGDTGSSSGGSTGGTTGGTSGGGAVLGESTTVYPTGAPNTGMGGGELQKLDGKMTLPLLSMIMVSLIGFGAARALRREEEETM